MVGEASKLLAEVITNRPILHSYLALVPRAIEISSDLKVGAYDCLYIALAEREGCSLVTADDKLIKALGPSFPVVPLACL